MCYRIIKFLSIKNDSTQQFKCQAIKLNKLKSAVKNETEAVLRLLSNMTDNSNDETNFPHKLLLPDKSLTDIMLSKALT